MDIFKIEWSYFEPLDTVTAADGRHVASFHQDWSNSPKADEVRKIGRAIAELPKILATLADAAIDLQLVASSDSLDEGEKSEILADMAGYFQAILNNVRG